MGKLLYRSLGKFDLEFNIEAPIYLSVTREIMEEIFHFEIKLSSIYHLNINRNGKPRKLKFIFIPIA